EAEEDEDDAEDEQDEAPPRAPAPSAVPASPKSRPAPRKEAPLPVEAAPAPAPPSAAQAPRAPGEPAWLVEMADAVRFVERGDVEGLTEPALRALEADLAQRADALARSLHETGTRGEQLLRDVNAQLVRVSGLLEGRDRPAGLASRFLRRADRERAP
ncbi:MAG TPA: hypothetical protein VHH36_09260, partial [Candidatus Thermoplasmatota archaeon]|nr:hypothetical protein [Candidatus Thermoplasmatota archaeon]